MLKYTGGGYGGFAPNVPARDLTDAEVEQYGGETMLLGSGVYERFGESKAARRRYSDKSAMPAAEDKTE